MTEPAHGMTYGEAVKDTLTQLAPIFNAIRALHSCADCDMLLDRQYGVMTECGDTFCEWCAGKQAGGEIAEALRVMTWGEGFATPALDIVAGMMR